MTDDRRRGRGRNEGGDDAAGHDATGGDADGVADPGDGTAGRSATGDRAARADATDDRTSGEGAAGARSPPVEWSVPENADPVPCPYCGRPFARAAHRDLHVGLDHPDRADDAEREAFREGYSEETEEIRLFRLKVVGVLVVLYFGTLFAYSAIT